MSEQSDGALLRAFLGNDNQPAFEALVRRHGPMVLRVCRRALGNAHDADDAFQATFLVLARQARTIRKRESLASWLHGVAHRMTTHAKRAAARRHRHESRANSREPRDPALSAAWQEIRVLLDEEIERLPEALRTTFVLCCLENQSCLEAARLLGLQEATVWKRLRRARKLLQERLTRRGVSLAAVLAAAAVGANAAFAGVPRSLVRPTVKAAAEVAAGRNFAGGSVSAQVISLVEGVTQAMFVSKCKTVILLQLGTALVGTGLGWAALRCAAAEPMPFAAQAPQQAAIEGSKKEQRQLADAPKQTEGNDHVKVSGRVLDPDGKPFGGARLYLGGDTSPESFDDPKKPTYHVRARSGDDGRFAFTFAKTELEKSTSDGRVYRILAVADGHGCCWATTGSAAEELTLRLPKDAPISGRIVDADGKPVVGATLRVDGITVLSGPKRQGLAFAYDTDPFGDYDQDLAKGWAGPIPGQPAVLTTDGEGRYRMAGVGRDRVLFLHLQGRGIAVADLGVISGAPADYVARATRPIRGVVRDQETGKPVAGVSVFRDFWGITRWGKAVTDPQGRYELLGLAKAPAYALKVEPAKGQPYFSCNVRLEDTPGLDAFTADVELARGKVVVSGKVTDKATGEPLAGVRVDYHPLYPNDTVTKMTIGSSPNTWATTGADGSYTLAVMAGPGLIGVTSPKADAYMEAHVTPEEIKGFFKAPVKRLEVAVGGLAAGLFPTGSHNAAVLLEPGAEENKLVKDVSLEPALERKGRVVGPDGEPITGVKVWGLSSQWYQTQTLKGADFTIRGLNPSTDRQLSFQHSEKKFATAITAKGAEAAAELTVRLQPCGSFCGRILDQDGQPVAGIRIEFWPDSLPGDRPECITDKEGRFRADGALPNQKHNVMHIRKLLPVYGIADNVAVEPGKVKDLGDIKLPNY